MSDKINNGFFEALKKDQHGNSEALSAISIDSKSMLTC
jgi:hypothetical protein